MIRWEIARSKYLQKPTFKFDQKFEEVVKFETENGAAPKVATPLSTASTPSSSSNKEGYNNNVPDIPAGGSKTEITRDSTESIEDGTKQRADEKKDEQKENRIETIQLSPPPTSAEDLKTKSSSKIVDEKYIPIQQRVKNELGRH